MSVKFTRSGRARNSQLVLRVRGYTAVSDKLHRLHVLLSLLDNVLSLGGTTIKEALPRDGSDRLLAVPELEAWLWRASDNKVRSRLGVQSVGDHMSTIVRGIEKVSTPLPYHVSISLSLGLA